ncbi:protein of unknown function DUF4378 [Macleaya cordata]|uniref:DUF4378 domain-containing protein n=1 Tax=Macleaya cordata TaxID=56857 RepID=A0A200PPK2_MACCD|nr:protein of unknown function DUF4378 [Macleaya cordata]
MGREKYRVLGGGKRGSNREQTTTTATTVPSGCMSGVLHFFDFHHFQFSSLNQQLVCFKPTNNVDSFIQEEEEQPNITNIKGVEAPRNSLESEENLIMGGADETVLLSSSEMNKEEDFVFPVGIRVHTKVVHQGEGISDFSSSESSNSPCIKTPNLVARLMGLDLLPEALSPSPSSACSSIHTRSTKTHHGNYLQDSINGGYGSHHQLLRTRHNDIAGSRSLPDTPRISSARRSDVDPSRLSLQINKENMSEELDYFSARSSVDSIRSLNSFSLKKSRKREWKSEETENRSPSHYARQIVKQVKESVSRKMGRDITNLTNNNNNINSKTKPIDAETQTVTRTKKTSRLNRTGDDSTPSCSPRLRFLETKNTKPVSTSQDQNSNLSPRPISKPPPISPAPPPPQPLPRQQSKVPAKPKLQRLPQHQTIEKCKKASCERFTQRKEVASPASKKANLNLSEHKKCKKSSSTLSKDLSISPSPTPTPTPTSMFQSSKPNSSQFKSNSSIQGSYDHHHHRDDKFTGSVAEFRYVSRILKCTGIETNTYVSITRWFSPSHPLDPSIFHHLEESFFPTGSLKHRSNRRLIFNLVDEILVEILRPYLNMKPWILKNYSNKMMIKNKLMRGDQLLQKIWLEIQNSPLSNCEILQDIDALIEKDLPPDANMRTFPIFEEGESIVFEIEKDILDSLVHELALSAFSMN